MKRWRYMKLMIAFLMVLVLFLYIFSENIKYMGNHSAIEAKVYRSLMKIGNNQILGGWMDIDLLQESRSFSGGEQGGWTAVPGRQILDVGGSDGDRRLGRSLWMEPEIGVYGRNFTWLPQSSGLMKTDAPPIKSKNRNPFLCPSDITYKGWPTSRKAMPETLPFGTLSAERYFLEALGLLQRCDLPDQLKNSTFLNCIVIGNGGVLRNRNLGKKINSYDVVIRLNNGPVIGYENDVGNKTTFRFCYPESFFNERSQHNVNTTMVFIPFKFLDLRWLKEVLLKKKVSLRGFWKKPPLNLTYENNQVRILNPSVVQRAAFKLLNLPRAVSRPKPSQYPTTGIIAISMAVTMCDEVHIAGFKYDVKNPKSTLHYYGNESMSAVKKMVYHNVTAEQILLNDLKSSNRIFDLTGNF